jgi:hypothetical protein
MAFNFLTAGASSDGEIIPIIKYDARDGSLSRRDRIDGEYTDVPINKDKIGLFDIGNIEFGWIDFTNGRPDFAVAHHNEPVPAQPTPNHKRAARILIKMTKENGNDIREFAGNSQALLKGLGDLCKAYEAGAAQNPGKLPLVRLASTIAIMSGGSGPKTKNHQPVFEIVSWHDRPADFIWKPKSSVAAPVSRPAPPATGSARVYAPVDDDDFG